MNIAHINMNISHINMIICSYIPHSESPNDESQELGRRGFVDILFNSVVAHIRDFSLDWFARIRKGSSVLSFISATVRLGARAIGSLECALLIQHIRQGLSAA